jgi:hypothetical protein
MTQVVTVQRRIQKRLKVIEDQIAAKKRELRGLNRVLRLVKGIPPKQARAILREIADPLR